MVPIAAQAKRMIIKYYGGSQEEEYEIRNTRKVPNLDLDFKFCFYIYKEVSDILVSDDCQQDEQGWTINNY